MIRRSAQHKAQSAARYGAMWWREPAAARNRGATVRLQEHYTRCDDGGSKKFCNRELSAVIVADL